MQKDLSAGRVIVRRITWAQAWAIRPDLKPANDNVPAEPAKEAA